MLSVRPTRDDEIDDAYNVLLEVRDWLIAKGRRQRIANTTRATYEELQSAGDNFVVLSGGQIAGVFTVAFQSLPEWPSVTEKVFFLRALATKPDFRGKEVGATAVRFATTMNAPTPVYLDCVSGFLPEYYQRLGFERVDRQLLTCDDGDYDVTLMKSSSV